MPRFVKLTKDAGAVKILLRADRVESISSSTGYVDGTAHVDTCAGTTFHVDQSAAEVLALIRGDEADPWQPEPDVDWRMG